MGVDSTAGLGVSAVAVAGLGIPEVPRRRAVEVAGEFGMCYQALVVAAATGEVVDGVSFGVAGTKAPISVGPGLAPGRDAAAGRVAASHGQHPLGVATLLLARAAGEADPALRSEILPLEVAGELGATHFVSGAVTVLVN
jgi:hypothetical protein